MLCTLFLVVLTYLLAAESFTYFLFPAPGEVARHFDAGALPGPLFDFLVLVFALMIILGWMLLYARSHGRHPRLPEWANRLQVRLYALLINRLYLDALARNVAARTNGWLRLLDGSRILPYVAALIALGMAFATTSGIDELSPAKIAAWILTAVALPLFPLHGAYVAALTRLPLPPAVGVALLLPSAGLFAAMELFSAEAPGLRSVVSMLALTGALWGSFKALATERVPHIVAYAGVAFFSVLWWHLAGGEIVAAQVIAYAAAVVLLSSAILLAWQRVQVRFGDLAPDRIGGLARPMPRFAVLLSLLAMAAMGLPPFGLFFAFTELLLRTAGENLASLGVMLLTWFAASWYLFRMMQRLLFGRPRADLLYDDLRLGEVAVFSILLLALAGIGVAPYGLAVQDRLTYGYRTVMETLPWLP
jgi:NADH-quinone oxidoreductase subunit M